MLTGLIASMTVSAPPVIKDVPAVSSASIHVVVRDVPACNVQSTTPVIPEVLASEGSGFVWVCSRGAAARKMEFERRCRASVTHKLLAAGLRNPQSEKSKHPVLLAELVITRPKFGTGEKGEMALEELLRRNGTEWQLKAIRLILSNCSDSDRARDIYSRAEQAVAAEMAAGTAVTLTLPDGVTYSAAEQLP